MALLIRKLKAYTLIETIISMVIIMLVFSVAMMIFINVVKTDRIIERTDVFFKMNEILHESKMNQEYIDFTYEFENFDILRSNRRYRNSENLKQLTVKAFDKNGKQIAEKSELIINF